MKVRNPFLTKIKMHGSSLLARSDGINLLRLGLIGSVHTWPTMYSHGRSRCKCYSIPEAGGGGVASALMCLVKQKTNIYSQGHIFKIFL